MCRARCVAQDAVERDVATAIEYQSYSAFVVVVVDQEDDRATKVRLGKKWLNNQQVARLGVALGLLDVEYVIYRFHEGRTMGLYLKSEFAQYGGIVVLSTGNGVSRKFATNTIRVAQFLEVVGLSLEVACLKQRVVAR